MHERFQKKKGRYEHDISEVCGGVTRNLKVATVELEQRFPKCSVIDI